MFTSEKALQNQSWFQLNGHEFQPILDDLFENLEFQLNPNIYLNQNHSNETILAHQRRNGVSTNHHFWNQ